LNSLNKTIIEKIKKANILTPQELAELETTAVPTEGKVDAPAPAMEPAPAPAPVEEDKELGAEEPKTEEPAMETPELPAEVAPANEPIPAIEKPTTLPPEGPMPAADAGVDPVGTVTVDDLAEVKKTTESLQAQIKALEEVISKLGEQETTEEFGITGKGKSLNGSDEYSDASEQLVKKMGGFSR
jgi:hypothetical protein